jgi:flagellar protein FliO/FliZ
LPLLLQAASSLGYGGLAFDLLRTLLALAAVCALGFFGLRWLAGRGVGGAGAGAHPGLRVLRRLPLEPRKSLYVVRAGKRLLLIGTGGEGPPQLIAELDDSAVAPEQQSSGPESPGA